jgi:hypothetical protein
MKLIRIHFTTGKVHEMNVHDGDAEGITATLNVDPNGTTCLNAPDGSIIINRAQVTHVQIIPAMTRSI